MTRMEEVEPALRMAKEEKTVPTVLEFVIQREENVLPIVPPGKCLDQMILGAEEGEG